MSDVKWQATEAFDIDAYIQGGAFGYRQSPGNVELEAEIARPVAWLLHETPIADLQTIEALPDSEWSRLSARVPDDQQTLWWLMGMGANVKVIAPASWRDTLKANAQKVLNHYHDTAAIS